MSTIEVPDGSPFGPDNLPYGVFAPAGGVPRVGVRLGDTVVDLSVLLGDDVFGAQSLNPFMAQGPARWTQVRERIGELVTGDVPDAAQHPVADVRMHLPFEVATTSTSTPPSTTRRTSAACSGRTPSR